MTEVNNSGISRNTQFTRSNVRLKQWKVLRAFSYDGSNKFYLLRNWLTVLDTASFDIYSWFRKVGKLPNYWIKRTTFQLYYIQVTYLCLPIFLEKKYSGNKRLFAIFPGEQRNCFGRNSTLSTFSRQIVYCTSFQRNFILLVFVLNKRIKINFR